MSVDRRQMTRLRSSVFTFSFDPTRRASVFALRASPRHVAAAGRGPVFALQASLSASTRHVELRRGWQKTDDRYLKWDFGMRKAERSCSYLLFVIGY